MFSQWIAKGQFTTANDLTHLTFLVKFCFVLILLSKYWLSKSDRKRLFTLKRLSVYNEDTSRVFSQVFLCTSIAQEILAQSVYRKRPVHYTAIVRL